MSVSYFCTCTFLQHSRTRQHSTTVISASWSASENISNRRYYVITLLTCQNPLRRQNRRDCIREHIRRTQAQAHHQPGFEYGPFTPLGEPAPAYQAQDLPCPIPHPAQHNIWRPNQDPAPEEQPDWEAIWIQITHILRERENNNPAPPRGQSLVIPPHPVTPHPSPVLDPRLRINPVTEYIETLIPVEAPVLTAPADIPYTPVTPGPGSVVTSRTVTPVPTLVKNCPLHFNPTSIYHHWIHRDVIRLVHGPIREPATHAYIWSYCTEHRLFEELQSGHQHHKTAVVFRGITPEDATRNNLNIENLSITFQNVDFLRQARNKEKKTLTRDLHIPNLASTRSPLWIRPIPSSTNQTSTPSYNPTLQLWTLWSSENPVLRLQLHHLFSNSRNHSQ